MRIERILNLKEYEIAEVLSIREMVQLTISLELDLSQIVADYRSSWFYSPSKALIKMQSYVEAHKGYAERLVEKFKHTDPSQTNRFILELAEIQYKYAAQVTSDSIANEAIRQCYKNEMQYLLVKKKPQQKINKTKMVDEKSKSETELLIEEIKALRNEVQELKNKINKKMINKNN